MLKETPELNTLGSGDACIGGLGKGLSPVRPCLAQMVIHCHIICIVPYYGLGCKESEFKLSRIIGISMAGWLILFNFWIFAGHNRWIANSQLDSKTCVDGLVQERRNSIANALELHLSCTNPSIWYARFYQRFWCAPESVFLSTCNVNLTITLLKRCL